MKDTLKLKLVVNLSDIRTNSLLVHDNGTIAYQVSIMVGLVRSSFRLVHLFNVAFYIYPEKWIKICI